MLDDAEANGLHVSEEEILDAESSMPSDYRDLLMLQDESWLGVDGLSEREKNEIKLSIAGSLVLFAMSALKIVDLGAASEADIDRAVGILCDEDERRRKEPRLVYATSLRECGFRIEASFGEMRDLACLVLAEKERLVQG